MNEKQETQTKVQYMSKHKQRKLEHKKKEAELKHKRQKNKELSVFGHTEEISEAEILASCPFLVIDRGFLKSVVPTQGITNSVVLVSLDRSWKRDEKKTTRENEEQKTGGVANSLFHSSSSWGV